MMMIRPYRPGFLLFLFLLLQFTSTADALLHPALPHRFHRPPTTWTRRSTTTRLYGEYEEYMAARRRAAEQAQQQQQQSSSAPGQPPFPDLASGFAGSSSELNNNQNPPRPFDEANYGKSTNPPPFPTSATSIPGVSSAPAKKSYSPGGGSSSWKKQTTTNPAPPILKKEEQVQDQSWSASSPSSWQPPSQQQWQQQSAEPRASWSAPPGQPPPQQPENPPPVVPTDTTSANDDDNRWLRQRMMQTRTPPPNLPQQPQQPAWSNVDDPVSSASSLDPPVSMAGAAPVLNDNQSLLGPRTSTPPAGDTTTTTDGWWKSSSSPAVSLDPPVMSGAAPVVDGQDATIMRNEKAEEESLSSSSAPWWKISGDAAELSSSSSSSLDPATNAGQAPVLDVEKLRSDNPILAFDETMTAASAKEPPADVSSSSSAWWKVGDLAGQKGTESPSYEATPPPPPKRVESKKATVPDEQEKPKKSPWWKGIQAAPKQAARPPLTMQYSSSAATVSEHILKSCPSETQASGAGGASNWDAFQRVEENWRRLRFGLDEPPLHFVTNDAAVGNINPKCWDRLRQLNRRAQPLDYDILVCGGTLGIFFATALAMKGHRVGVLEAGKLRGRAQEWNISQKELDELIEMGILSQDDVEAAIQTDFPACRSGFKNDEVSPLEGGYFSNNIGYECVTPDVLNLGISPAVLLERVRKRFEKLGGVVYESTRLEGIALSSAVGVALDVGDKAEPITAQLVLDCMGNASPISKQQRAGEKPDGVCAVVGSCASGFDASSNIIGDIIYTLNPIQDKGANGKLQYFWEAFPVGIGRNGVKPGMSDLKTTYMFTYMDAEQERPSLLTLMEDYWQLLPTYQPSIQNPVTDLDVKRVLFAYFPTYRDSPLKPKWDRILAVGDASGIQSPLSFSGLGALTRHLGRITTAVDEAMTNKLLDKENLGAINSYTPNLSAAWMFQKAMSVRMGQNVDEKFVNRLLAVNFEVMDGMGLQTIKPFLQDVIRFDGLVGSLARSFVADPTYMPTIVAHVGIPRLVDWLGHVTMMGTYDVLHRVVSPILRPVVNKAMKDPVQQYRWRRRMESWEFGSGNDYVFPADEDDDNQVTRTGRDDEEMNNKMKPETTETFAPFS